MGMKDTGTGKTVQFYFIFRDLLIREYSLIGYKEKNNIERTVILA
jgi:hypothetical protein